MPNQKNLPTEEELAVLAANGDDESMALLISAVTPIAKAKAISFATVGISDEDLLQEGMLGFLDAVRSFDPSKEIRFRTFAETCIHNRIVSAVRVHFNNKNAALSNALPFEPETADIGDSDADPANIVPSLKSRLLIFACKTTIIPKSLQLSIAAKRLLTTLCRESEKRCAKNSINNYSFRSKNMPP